MTLFDDIERQDLSKQRSGEPVYAYYSRSGRPEIGRVRQVLEAWFARYPPDARDDLLARFHRGSDEDLRSAAFELCLHELLCRLGCEVEVHPERTGVRRHPEFAVRAPDGELFSVEADVATGESQEEAAARARLGQVYAALDRFDSPAFWLYVNVSGKPAKSPGVRRVRQKIARYLERLDPNEVEHLWQRGEICAIPTWEFDLEGAKLRISPIAKPAHLRGRSGLGGMGGEGSEGPTLLAVADKAIKNAVIRKATWYGEMDRPYVVAVNPLVPHVPSILVEAGLYGTLVDLRVSECCSAERERLMRLPDGVWAHNTGPQCTRVSAVLVVDGLIPWDLDGANVRLYHNPHARSAYTSVLTRLPQGRLSGCRVDYEDGEQLSRLLGLPAGWRSSA